MPSTASSSMRATPSGVAGSGRRSRASASRCWARSWRPRKCSTSAQATVSWTHICTASSGTSASVSSRVARLCSSCPLARQGRGARHQQPQPLLGRSVVRKHAQGGAEPARGAGGRAHHRRSPPACRRSSTASVSPGAAACSTWCARAAGGRAALGERLGAALVGAEHPAAGRRLVDDRSHQRVAEAKAARHVRSPHEVARSSRRAPRCAAASSTPAAAAASSGSNGSPATAAPSNRRRAGSAAARALRSARRPPLAAPPTPVSAEIRAGHGRPRPRSSDRTSSSR